MSSEDEMSDTEQAYTRQFIQESMRGMQEMYQTMMDQQTMLQDMINQQRRVNQDIQENVDRTRVASEWELIRKSRNLINELMDDGRTYLYTFYPGMPTETEERARASELVQLTVIMTKLLEDEEDVLKLLASIIGQNKHTTGGRTWVPTFRESLMEVLGIPKEYLPIVAKKNNNRRVSKENNRRKFFRGNDRRERKSGKEE
eukprot:TRINITY_DN3296_c2_g1_i1.p2 TRINITY_DN3296_c2_g1~~TRINITY_DN3296_c2_g1_i1.p2  ORF type:complete len:201 (-),score=20.65 TRINITY_DN3296_c2_g1_i1:3456-4058(-)